MASSSLDGLETTDLSNSWEDGFSCFGAVPPLPFVASSSLDGLETTDLSNSWEDVFLCHSGKQKDFVEHLYHALRRANQRVFFDKESLPRGSDFPPAIATALKKCKLGVIVVSDEFFMSKWPMMELDLLRKKNTDLLPLFYALSPGDLKSSDNITKWRNEWMNITKDEKRTDEWATNVGELRRKFGICFEKSTSQKDYIDKVVTEICDIIVPNPLYDQSFMQGREALVKEIESYFVDASANKGEKACMVGVHGVGGLGKTTLCQSMVNCYRSRYLGRSCVIEFPTNCDKREVVKVCITALERLANLSEAACKRIDTFNQVVSSMKEHLTKFDVFLAIDNVWSDFSEDIKRLLDDVAFTSNSKILVTSRSETVLQELFRNHSKNSHIRPLPVPNPADAFKIFQFYVDRGDLASLLFSDENFSPLLNRCRYNGEYHALALKAMGLYVLDRCPESSSDMNEDDWHSIVREVEDAALEDVYDTIALNYQGLKGDLKYMFLDIVVCMHIRPGEHFFDPKRVSYPGFVFKRTLANAVLLLSILYEKAPTHIVAIIKKLARAGVLQYRDGEEIITLHDLYRDLAMKEASSSPRFLTSTKEASDEMEPEKLERVILVGNDGGRVLEGLRRRKLCKNVKLLIALGIEGKTPIYLELLTPFLRILISGRDVLIINGLVDLGFLWIKANSQESVEGLETLRNLRKLCVSSPSNLWNSDNLRCLCPACSLLKKLPDLGGLTRLQKLELNDHRSLEEVGCLSPALQELSMKSCRKVKKLTGLGGLTRLQKLELNSNMSLEEVGCLSPALQELSMRDCHSLKKLPDLSGLTRLQKLDLGWNWSLEEVGCLSPALEELSVKDCKNLKKLPDLSGLTRLQQLHLWGNMSLEEVRGPSPALEELRVEGCEELKKLPDLSGLTRLQKLYLVNNRSLEEVGCLSPALELVFVRRCDGLKKFPDLSGLTRLQKLYLGWNWSLEEVGCLSPALEVLSVEGCDKLKKLPDRSGLTRLQKLDLSLAEQINGFWWVDSIMKFPAVEPLLPWW